MIVDFAHPDWFNMSSSTGMASNPDDPHYDNLTAGWLKGEYVRMNTSEKDYMAGNKGIVVMNPGAERE